MRKLCLAVFVLAALAGYTLQSAAQSMMPQTLAGTGVSLRADSIITIDAWTNYAAPTMAANPTIASRPLTTTSAPSKVILGESLADDLRICVEGHTGTTCTTLGAVRTLAGVASPKR
jgi:hypothetical protein